MDVSSGSGRRRLVLGFDAGCMTCSDLAKRIEERVADKLEVRSLYHPQVEHWRERALGEDAPWAPTLFEVGGAWEVRAWTGRRMAVRLARALGPLSTWRVMQVLGEVGASKAAADGSPIARIGAAGMTRGQFLKGVGGAAVAFGVLSGVSSPARAAEDELDFDGLVEAFSTIEQIPDSVIARGDQAASEWLERRLQGGTQPGTVQAQGSIGACAWAILKAVAANVVPVTKIRAAIRAVGGAWRFAKIIRNAYLGARARGYSRWGAIKYAARRVQHLSGVKVYDALLNLFGLDAVVNACF
jgi:hypothetical protein